jgi:hypothetical protein
MARGVSGALASLPLGLTTREVRPHSRECCIRWSSHLQPSEQYAMHLQPGQRCRRTSAASGDAPHVKHTCHQWAACGREQREVGNRV